MQRVLVLYGTTEGQTRKIAGFVADRLRASDREVSLIDAAAVPEGLDPAAFDVVIVAASVHVGSYQSAVVHFVRTHVAAIAAKPNAFLSVSLAAMAPDGSDRQGLEDCVAKFCHATGWTPQRVEHVAGAFLYTQHDFFKRLAMKYIARSKGGPTDTSRDFEYTDWDALGRFADAFGGRTSAAA